MLKLFGEKLLNNPQGTNKCIVGEPVGRREAMIGRGDCGGSGAERTGIVNGIHENNINIFFFNLSHAAAYTIT